MLRLNGRLSSRFLFYKILMWVTNYQEVIHIWTYGLKPPNLEGALNF